MQARKLKAKDLNAYLPEGFRIVPYSRGIRLIAPDSELGWDLYWGAKRYLKDTAEDIRGVIQITWEGCSDPLEVKPSNLPPLRPVAKANVELDLTKLYNFEKCVYINEIATQKNLWCNNAAIAAQGKKPSEFLGATAYELNYEDELQHRMRNLIADRTLTDYDYRALRWTRDESGLWVRKQMSFFSEFHLIEYLGERCWLGIVHQATETGAHADGVLSAG